MASHQLRPHLAPQEIARRQRWVAVGVVILAFLLVATWFATLPSRISNATDSSLSWQSLVGEVPKTNFIDADKLINNETRAQNEIELTNAVNILLTASATSTTP
ncbi:MAG: hypothetical protein A2848_00040 [Candidatus Magasanikbacteria bacterium RIFCSPHIGHO2_01_FULL_50_8]|uniref:Uncharacterized protein n=1 Tax=Candidatus Magasanikbacteria bacterium RIFCSPHIGHO2_01_FULL_50_8 TaxID=1798674 RepID=A0A1F6LNI8_9BACT|nr:MAG: hypothetical protein A2848_00040 [Candidatus Magasanikbacteria bacterium RIFCSPHIGHO2_01_FULL_50_8]